MLSHFFPSVCRTKLTKPLVVKRIFILIPHKTAVALRMFFIALHLRPTQCVHTDFTTGKKEKKNQPEHTFIFSQRTNFYHSIIVIFFSLLFNLIKTYSLFFLFHSCFEWPFQTHDIACPRKKLKQKDYHRDNLTIHAFEALLLKLQKSLEKKIMIISSNCRCFGIFPSIENE